MTETPSWVTPDVDTERPSIARLYDYLLGGTHHLEVDRRLGREAIKAAPGLVLLIRENRKFLRRAVRYALEQGVDQFLDIGSGIPTRGSIHETARKAGSDARVVYVDVDPVAVSHGRAILADDPRTTILRADFFQPDDILGNAEVVELIDFTRPVALLVLNMIHFFPDAKVRPALARYRDTLAPESLLMLSVATDDTTEAGAIDTLYQKEYTEFTLRSRAEITALFDGFEFVEPGVVYPPQWRPTDPDRVTRSPERYSSLVGVGRVPREPVP
ncbi:SAM-dependent methyltransferase [Streptosporangium algeriense]|uniref:SAM-dependent methyltransferase n=1 Tax=Streptosporangium algeriense TaxID=1682748 RepID=A0ABW3DPE3_9ACTN